MAANAEFVVTRIASVNPATGEVVDRVPAATEADTLRAIDAVRSAKASVAGVLALVDREEGGRQAIEMAGVSVVSLATATQIIAALTR